MFDGMEIEYGAAMAEWERETAARPRAARRATFLRELDIERQGARTAQRRIAGSSHATTGWLTTLRNLWPGVAKQADA